MLLRLGIMFITAAMDTVHKPLSNDRVTEEEC